MRNEPAGIKQEPAVNALTVEQLTAIAVSVQAAAAERAERTKEREKAAAVVGTARPGK
jgi:hypothetical protein